MRARMSANKFKMLNYQQGNTYWTRSVWKQIVRDLPLTDSRETRSTINEVIPPKPHTVNWAGLLYEFVHVTYGKFK